MSKGILRRLAESLGITRELTIEDVVEDPSKRKKYLQEKGCPEREDFYRLRDLGLYELIVWFARAGCSIPKDLEGEVKSFFTLLGRPEKGIIGGELPPTGGVAVAVCSEGRIVFRYEDLAGDTTTISREGAARILSNSDPVGIAAYSLKASLLIVWGCHTGFPRIVDVKLLSSIALAESGGLLYRAVYHFGAPTSNPADSVAYILLKSVELLEDLGVQWESLPNTVSLAPEAAARLKEDILVSEPRLPRARVVITDRPRYGIQSWTPVRAKPPKIKLDGEYRALASIALESINRRGGDALEALSSLKAGNSPIYEALVDLVRSSELQFAEAVPRTSHQVNVSHLRYYWGELDDALLDCILPVDLCLATTDDYTNMVPEDILTRYREVLAHSLSTLYRRRGRLVTALKTGGWSPQESSILAGISIYTSEEEPSIQAIIPNGRGPAALAEAIKTAISSHNQEGTRILVITPDGPVARMLSRLLNATLLREADAIDKWYIEGGVGIVSWAVFKKNRELARVSSLNLVVLPEVMLRDENAVKAVKLFYRGKLSFYKAQLGRMREMASRLGAIAVTWSPLVREAPTSSHQPAQAGLKDHDVLEGFKTVINSMWKGVTPKPGQEVVLRRLSTTLATESPTLTIAVLPTGYGKSLLFQTAARVSASLAIGSLTIVVSPLRALMRDQTRNALAKGLVAMYIEASIPSKMKDEIIRSARDGLLDLLYLSPERFEDERVLSLLDPQRISLAVLDEAHAVSRWGETFRNSYLYMAKTLSALRAAAGWPPLLALTATATPDIIESIVSMLGESEYHTVDLEDGVDGAVVKDVSKPLIVRVPPLRGNIEFDVRIAPSGVKRLDVTADYARELSSWANTVSDSWVGVIFTGFVKSRRLDWANAESISRRIENSLPSYISVYVYHGQLSDRRRKTVESAISDSSSKSIVVATKAFGMGVDIPNIRWTLHAYPSDSIEDLVQEVGRAGRDGLPARGVILFNPEDLEMRRRMTLSQVPKLSRVIALYNAVVRLSREVGSQRLVIPFEGLPWGRRSLRLLDALRTSGYLDYYIAKRLHAYKGSKGWRSIVEDAGVELVSSLPGDVFIALRELGRVEWAVKTRIAIYTCVDDKSGVVNLSYEKAPRSPSKCAKSFIGDGGESPYLIVELNPEIRHREQAIPDEELLVYAKRLSSLEILRVQKLSDMLEEASSAGQRASDVVKQHIKRYFSEPLLPVLDSESNKLSRLPSSIECPSIRNCKPLSSIITYLEDTLGPIGYTIATETRDMASKIISSYTRNHRVRPRTVGVRRVHTLLVEGKVLDLSDLGYIVVATTKAKRAEDLARIAKKLDYSYITITHIKTPI